MSKKGLFHNKKFKKIQAMIYGIGAAIVIVGALFKILHWPGANTMLIVGLLTEAAIFLMSAFEPPHEDTPWERVYPELDDDIWNGEYAVAGANGGGAKPKTLTGALDSMLESANIDSNLLQRLGDNLNKLGVNIEKMSDVADVAGATSDYSAKAKDAANALASMKSAYAEATSAAQALAASSAGTQDYHNAVQTMTKNLATLNSVYGLELQDTSSHLKALNKFYGNMNEAMGKMEEAKQDAMKYTQEMTNLNKNLQTLNGIYGNMLNAMRSNG